MGRRFAAALACFLTFLAPVVADDLTAFNAAVEGATGHQRAALGYLRTENTDLALVELEQMKDAWSGLTARYAGKPPERFRDSKLFGVTMAEVPKAIGHVIALTESRRHDLAYRAIQDVRRQLAALRRASGIEVLADCVLDANAAMDALFVFRRTPPVWSKEDSRAELAAKALAYGDRLKRCDAMAPPNVRTDAEFRRLIDGARESLALMPQVISGRDGDRLQRILIELRSFDHLLAFRYG